MQISPTLCRKGGRDGNNTGTWPAKELEIPFINVKDNNGLSC